MNRNFGKDSVTKSFAWPTRRPSAAWLLLCVAGACTWTLVAAMTGTVNTPAPSIHAKPATVPTIAEKPSLTQAEEAYIQALWPVHGEVERVTSRRSLGVILYKTTEIDKADLKARMEVALKTYRFAVSFMQALEVPTSLIQAHKDYLAAIRLLEAAAVESLKMFEDGHEDHLLAAYQQNQQGTDIMREIGGRFWRDEFPPN